MKLIKLSIFLLMFALQILNATTYTDSLYSPNHILLESYSSLDSIKIDSLKSYAHLSNLTKISENLNFYLGIFDTSVTNHQAIFDSCAKFSFVKSTSYDGVIEMYTWTPNDTYFSSNQGYMNIVEFLDAWNAYSTSAFSNISSFGGKNIEAAVVDFGFYLSHEDLNFDITNKLHFSGNSSSSDVYGLQYGGLNHGTNVSGQLGAIGNNSKGIIGAAPGVKILPIQIKKVESEVFLALEYIRKLREDYNNSSGTSGLFITVVNLSIGKSSHYDKSSANNTYIIDETTRPQWTQLINQMGELGILTIAAVPDPRTGGIDIDDSDPYHSCMPSKSSSDYLIVVGSTGSTTTDKDIKSSFSDYGQYSVDLFAPGNLNFTTDDPYGGGSNYDDIDIFSNPQSGTSLSAPLVAGTIALMMAAAPQSFIDFYNECPSCGALYLKKLLMDHVDPVSGLATKCVSGGRLNAYNAVNAIKNFSPTTLKLYGVKHDASCTTDIIVSSNFFSNNGYLITHSGGKDYYSREIVYSNLDNIEIGANIKGSAPNFKFNSFLVKPFDNNSEGYSLEKITVYSGNEIDIKPCTEIYNTFSDINTGTEFRAAIKCTLQEKLGDPDPDPNHYEVPITLANINTTLSNYNYGYNDQCGNCDGSAEGSSEKAAEKTSIVLDRVFEIKPNPFNNTTEISFLCYEPEQTRLVLTNSYGLTVNNFNELPLKKGMNTLTYTFKDMASGVYFLTLQSLDYTETKKLIMIK